MASFFANQLPAAARSGVSAEPTVPQLLAAALRLAVRARTTRRAQP